MLDFLPAVSLMLPPAAIAAIVAALYYVYPYPLIQGFNRYGSFFMAGLHRKFVQAGGITFCYFERPETRSPQTAAAPPATLLFLHGFSANKVMWMPIASYFPPEWRIVMVDMPGHGESGFLPGADYTAKGMARKLHEFIHTLGLKNVHLIGVSMGSIISASYTSLYPDDVESLSIMCIPVVHKLPEGVKTRFFQELDKGNILVMPHNGQQFREMLELVLYNPRPYIYHRRLLDALVKVQEPNYSHMREIMQDMTGDEAGNDPVHIYSMADNIKAPTLVLWGDSDQICHPSGAGITGRLIKGSQVVVVENCGHAMTLDQPEKCSKLIRQFILGVTSSSADLS